MKLQSKTSSQFPKFETVGDKVHGPFVSYKDNEPGRFGMEQILTLGSPRGDVTVRCPSVLAGLLKDNLEHLTPGRLVTVTFSAEKEIGKPSPLKMFDVEVGDPPVGPGPNEADATEIPF